MTTSAEHRSKFAAFHRQWWRIHMSEKFSSGTQTPTNTNKQFSLGEKGHYCPWRCGRYLENAVHTLLSIICKYFWALMYSFDISECAHTLETNASRVHNTQFSKRDIRVGGCIFRHLSFLLSPITIWLSLLNIHLHHSCCSVQSFLSLHNFTLSFSFTSWIANFFFATLCIYPNFPMLL